MSLEHLLRDEAEWLALSLGEEFEMPRIKTKWLIAWFSEDGRFLDAVERSLTGAPRKWARDRQGDGRSEIWNISDPEMEKSIREMLDDWNSDLEVQA